MLRDEFQHEVKAFGILPDRTSGEIAPLRYDATDPIGAQ